MIDLSKLPEIYIYTRPVDFRKAINGLSSLVESELSMKPFDGALYVFIHKRRNKVKILYWDKTGFALWYKRLEEEKYSWPRGGFKSDVLYLSSEQLSWLLSGVDIWTLKKHKEVEYEESG